MGLRPMFRVAKDQSTQLFRFINQIDISLNPWSGYKLASTKEFWRSVTVPRLKKVNPKCQINYVIHNKDEPPAISVKFLDGSVHNFQPAEMDVVEIISDVHQVAYTLNAKMEDQGKTLDG